MKRKRNPPQSAFARLEAQRIADQDEYRKAVTEQAMVHFRENALVPQQFDIYREALRDAIRLLDATRRNEWTPADTKRLEEIRATAS